LTEDDALAAFHLFDGLGGWGRDEDIGFEHGGKVDHVKRGLPLDGFFDHVGVDVEGRLEEFHKGGDVSKFEGCDEIDVLGRARDAMH
jgi:hypothetical protein